VAFRLLIAEDEPELVEAYKIAFPRYGLEVIAVAMDGEEAVRAYKQHKDIIDAVIMDHRMPVKSGLEASEEILRFDPNAVIVFGSADTWAMAQARQLGVKAFEKKPFTVQSLVDSLRKVLPEAV
jgi:two-component system, chemotaxis family, chemotaxis protein CheY